MRRALGHLQLRWRVLTAPVRDASRLGRAQAAAGAAAVAAVAGAFAYGAATRDATQQPDGLAHLPGTTAHAGARHPRPLGAYGSRQRLPIVPLPASRLEIGGSGLDGTPQKDGKNQSAPSKGGPPRNRSRRPHPPASAPPAAGVPGGETPVVVAVAYQPASVTAKLLAALGLDEEPGDMASQARAVADWISAHGGIGGRRLEILPAPVDRATGAPFSAMCAQLVARTLQPVAVVARPDDAAGQTGCLAPHSLALVGDAPAVGDSEVFNRAGELLFAPGSMALDRLAGPYVRVLRRQGFLEPGTRIGVLRPDDPMFERADRRALRPALAAAGVTVAADAVIARPRTVADAPRVLSGVALAALRFRLARVDRVLALDAGLVTPLFMRASESLGFRPRYGLNSTMAPAALAARVPHAQLQRAQGVGFAPLLDVGSDREPAPPETRRRCEEIYRAAGVALGSRTVAGQYGAIATCDALLTVRAGLERATEATAGALPGGLAKLGRDRPSALALTGGIADGRHDGALTIRPLRFDGGCGCSEYSGPEEAVP